MANKMMFLVLLLFYIPLNVSAQRGCCSHHGGVAGCSDSERQICSDGTLSPSCTCTPSISHVYGCTNPSAKNYNPNANVNDGSCEFYVYGCTDSTAKNYNAIAERDDGSCKYYVLGCTDEKAENYNYLAEKDDGTCKYKEDNSSIGVLLILTAGGVGGFYYFKKKNKS